MPTLMISGKKIKVGDDFLTLSPEEQDAYVDDIATDLGLPEETANPPVPVEAPVVDPLSATNMPTPEQQFQYKKPVTREVFTPEEQEQADPWLNPMTSVVPNTEGAPPAPEGSTGWDQPYQAPVNSDVKPSVDNSLQTTDYVPATGNIDDVLAGITDEKGDITTNAYDNLTFEQAKSVYDALLNHPDTKIVKTLAGEVPVFRGHRLPFPEPNLFGGASPSGARVMQAGMMDGYSNLAQFALSGVDAITGRNDSEIFERPEMKAGSVGDSLLKDAAPIVAGGAGGLKVANLAVSAGEKLLPKIPGMAAVTKNLPWVSNVLGATAKGGTIATGVNVGSVAAVDEDTSGVFAGDDPMLGKNLDFANYFGDEDDPSTFAKKMNLAVDSFVAGGIIGLPAKAAAGLGKMAFGLVHGAAGVVPSTARTEAEGARVFLRELGLPENATPEQRNAFVKKLDDTLAEKSEDYIGAPNDAGPSNSNVKVDPLATLAAEGDDPLLRQNAETMRNNVSGAKLPEMEIKQKSYEKDVIDPLRRDLYDRGGGEAGVESARSGVVKSASDDLEAARMDNAGVRADLESADVDLKTMIETDPMFASDMTRLKDKTNVDIYSGVNQTEDDIAKNVRQAETVMADERRKLYDKIPANIKVEKKSFDPLVYQVDEETDELIFRDYLSTKQKGIIEKSGGSFKVLHNELVPDLSRTINAMIKKGDVGDKLDQLQELRDNIVDYQIDRLVSAGTSGLKKAGDAVTAARDYNREYMGFFGGKGTPLYKVRQANNQVIGNDQWTNPITEAKAQKDARTAVVKGMTGNENREYTPSLVRLLQTEAGGRSQDKVVDLYIGRSLLPMREALQNGEAPSVQDFVKNLSKDASSLSRDFPESYAKVTDFIKRINDAEGNVKQLEQIMAQSDEAFKAVDDSIKAEMAPFYNNVGELEEGQTIFDGLFSKDINITKKLIERTKKSGDPEAIKGLRGAFAKNLKLDPESFIQNNDHAMKVAREIYADEPDVLEAIDRGARLLKITQVGQGSPSGVRAAGADFEKEAKTDLGRLITLTFGVLNPTATRVRNLSNILTERNSPSDALIKVIGEMAADPDYFRQVMKQNSKMPAFGRNAPVLLDLFRRAGLYSGNRDSSDEEFMATVADIEAGNSDNTDSETEEVFGR